MKHSPFLDPCQWCYRMGRYVLQLPHQPHYSPSGDECRYVLRYKAFFHHDILFQYSGSSYMRKKYQHYELVIPLTRKSCIRNNVPPSNVHQFEQALIPRHHSTSGFGIAQTVYNVCI